MLALFCWTSMCSNVLMPVCAVLFLFHFGVCFNLKGCWHSISHVFMLVLAHLLCLLQLKKRWQFLSLWLFFVLCLALFKHFQKFRSLCLDVFDVGKETAFLLCLSDLSQLSLSESVIEQLSGLSTSDWFADRWMTGYTSEYVTDCLLDLSAYICTVSAESFTEHLPDTMTVWLVSCLLADQLDWIQMCAVAKRFTLADQPHRQVNDRWTSAFFVWIKKRGQN